MGEATGSFIGHLRKFIFSALCLLAITSCGDRTSDKTSPYTTVVDYSAPTGVPRKQAPAENVLKFVDATNVLTRQLFTYSIGQHFDSLGMYRDKWNSVYGFYNSSRLLGMLAAGAGDDMATKIGDALVPGFAVEDWLSVSCSLEGALGESSAALSDEVKLSKSTSAEIFDRYRLARDFLDNLVYGFGATFKPYQIDDPIHNRRRLTLSDSTEFSASLAGTSPETLPHDGLFEKLDGTQVWAPMVSIQGEYPFYENDQLQAVEIPFDSTGLSLVLLMPIAGSYNAVEDGIQSILPDVLSGMKTTSVNVSIPVFSEDEYNDLADFLYHLGLSQLFSEENADYSRVNGEGYLYAHAGYGSSDFSLSFNGNIIKGNSKASVNLYATKDEPSYMYGGSYGSISIMSIYSCPRHYVPAGAAEARPFIFLIRHKDTGLIMQMGRIVRVDGKDAGEWVCDSTSSLSKPTVPAAGSK